MDKFSPLTIPTNHVHLHTCLVPFTLCCARHFGFCLSLRGKAIRFLGPELAAISGRLGVHLGRMGR